MSINKCFLSGRLTKDAELRSTNGGTGLLTFGIAVNDRRKNPNTNEWEDVPNFFDCCVFGNRAGAIAQYMTKGTLVSIEGRLHWSSWESDGERRSKVEVIVDEVEFMSHGGDGQQRQQQTPPRQYGQAPSGYQQAPAGYQQAPSPFYDEDMPF